MHYDFFNATNVIIDNTGYGNIQFSSNAFDWSVKHANFFSGQAYTVIKAHAGFTFWGTSMYNGNVSSGNYLGNTHGTYGAGENIKLFFTVSNKAGTLELAALGYHIFSIPVTPEHSTGNVFFIDASIKYDVPITRYFGIGVNLRYWKLLGLYNSAENVYRALISTGVYLVFFTEK
ncbi:MAG: hypothetical protein Pg6A_06820 [Termitinemataceae bacterium]|nr:MAG: hypothetical protein Pg6A_06820 [Termitinemataceae bacterium]